MKMLYPQSKFPNTYDALEQVFNDTYNGIAVLNLEGSWLKVNDSLCKLLGYSKDELYNISVKDIVLKEDLNVHAKKYNKLIEGQIADYQVEQRFFSKSGEIIWMLISVSLNNNEHGIPHRMIWQFIDISERKKNQQKLKMKFNLVQDKNERLNSFADITTHNLRSHSGNLATLIEFLETDFPWINDNDNFSTLKLAAQNLQETVSHLSDVAQSKRVINKSEIEDLNLFDYSEKAIYNITALAKSTNAIILNNIDKNHHVKGIPAYLDSIILNFLTNAIKYRSEKRVPQIELTSSIQKDYVVLNIKDNGLGIDMKKFGDKIFQIYKTFHCNDDARGIGLFITKNHIESLGGKVIVDSKVDVGTEFSIFLKKGK
ncbi:sensor histidine kinase [Winogradskyella sp. SYSU M77433]|uniref:sensor histidine kinase n=1 Tax=Winogradskyella sp. SYSU M77433 TaxID=3042722 RepID=UPI00248031D5|nr:sensor histidine kinase [Winogradskyella sp. SYSU M77433]MDH7911490.1 PAS domain S-box protein [Winogradskyella sp. SYSU M77433]